MSASWVNACYELLDRAVVAGRADDPVLSDDTVTHARLLEDVAAVGGVLRSQGLAPGVAVRVSATGRQGLTALLAAARLGAVLSEAAPVLVDDDSVGELSWDETLKLGRTDPAPVADLPTGAPWSEGRTAGDLARDLAGVETPVPTDELLSVLRSTLES